MATPRAAHLGRCSQEWSPPAVREEAAHGRMGDDVKLVDPLGLHKSRLVNVRREPFGKQGKLLVAIIHD